jgi:hypothetical protein
MPRCLQYGESLKQNTSRAGSGFAALDAGRAELAHARGEVAGAHSDQPRPRVVLISSGRTRSCLSRARVAVSNESGERERAVLDLRVGLADGTQRALEEVGEHFGLTRERIR